MLVENGQARIPLQFGLQDVREIRRQTAASPDYPQFIFNEGGWISPLTFCIKIHDLPQMSSAQYGTVPARINASHLRYICSGQEKLRPLGHPSWGMLRRSAQIVLDAPREGRFAR